MLSALKSVLGRLAGAAGSASEGQEVSPVDYNGYRIYPTPYLSNNQYQTAGRIEKDTPEGVKEHKFIRADTYAAREDAITFTIAKAKQIIDLQGDRMFS